MDWDLIAWSFTVIRRNRQLVLFPAVSGACALAVIWVFSRLRYGGIQAMAETPHLGINDYLWGVPALFVASFVVIFLNCALAACVQADFSGERVAVADGLAHAAARLPRILMWTLISTTVGFVLDQIERRVSFLGKLTTWIFGFAWAMATYLIVPVLIAEDRSAFGSVKRAAQLARATWTDQIVGEIRFGWRTFFVALPGIVLLVIGMNGHSALMPFAVVYLVAVMSVISAAHGVFEVALYRYAARGETPRDWPASVPGVFR